MSENIYVRLCNHLNKFPLWAPSTDAFLEILKIMFTPEDAAFALYLKPRPETVPQIARRVCKDEQEVVKLLERMVDKGLVFKTSASKEEEVEQRYGLLPTAPGLWEVTFAKKERTPRTERLARLWREHYKSGWGKEMHQRIKTPAMRVLPVSESIGEAVEVLPYEKASEFIKTADFCAVLDCACRSASELAGEGCGKPTDVCLMFGDFARFLTETGRARRIDLEQALSILKLTEEAGLVHLTMNTSDAIQGLCSCCSCCCTQLRAIGYFSKPTAVAKSRFIAFINTDPCTGCEICQDRCQVDAIQMDNGVAVLLEERCIGCGLCVSTCPEDAVILTERADYEKPIPTIKELIKSF